MEQVIHCGLSLRKEQTAMVFPWAGKIRGPISDFQHLFKFMLQILFKSVTRNNSIQRKVKDRRRDNFLLHLVVVYWLGKTHLGLVFVRVVVRETEFLRRPEKAEVMGREFHPL